MMTKRVQIAALACSVLFPAANAMAGAFIDNFSSDTSANYTVTDTFGSGPSTIAISGGTLAFNVPGGTTGNVYHSTAQLQAGEYAAVDIVSTSKLDYYFGVSTITRGANTGTEDGIRVHVQNENSIRARVYRDGVVTDEAYGDGGLNLNALQGLYIYRDSSTEYRVAADDGNGIVVLGGFTIAETAGASGLYIGMEGFNVNGVYDNLRIAAIPEPASLALMGMGGLLVLRRRRVK